MDARSAASPHSHVLFPRKMSLTPSAGSPTKVSWPLVLQTSLGLHPPNIWDSNQQETVQLDFFKGFFGAQSETHRTRGSREPSIAEEGGSHPYKGLSGKRDASTGRGLGSTWVAVEGRSGKDTAGFQPPIDEPCNCTIARRGSEVGSYVLEGHRRNRRSKRFDRDLAVPAEEGFLHPS